MRKIYSFVLIAAALLIGTSAWAQANVAHVNNITTPTKSGDYQTLNQAFDNGVGDGDSATITLLTDAEISSVILMNGGNDNSGDGKRITLDLGDHKNIIGKNSAICMFVLTKGELHITGTGTIRFENIKNDGTYTGTDPWISKNTGVCVAVMGSVNPSTTEWSHLIVDENVTLNAAYAAVQLQAENTSATYGLANNKYWTKWVDGKTSSTLTSGNITFDDIWDHCNDVTRIPSDIPDTAKKATIVYANNKYNKQRPGNATLGFGYGINVDIYGTLIGRLYGLQIKGQITATPKIPWENQDANFPHIYVHPSSTIQSADKCDAEFPWEDMKNAIYKQPTAIYASGYAIWNIQGHVEGANGVYVKMGEIVVEGGAVVKSNATDTTAAHHTKSGVSGAGNAITLQSDWSDGTMGITIKADENGGTPEISSSANGGAAIVETATIPNNPESQVQNITIEGGNFSGDVNGCVVISDNFDGDISVSGGTYTGSIKTLIDAMEDDSTSIIQTVVAQNGNTATVVIGQKAEGDDLVNTNTEDAIDNFAFVADMSNDIVKLDAQVKPISKNLGDLTHVTVKYLSLTGKNADTLSVVTVGSGKTLEVGQIVMNAYGKIVVEAGGKLVVTGTNGIFASKNENLVLKAEEGKSAIFLLSPAVQFNKNPKATVKYYSKAYTGATQADNIHQYFGVPMKDGAVESMVAEASDGGSWRTIVEVWRQTAYDRIGILEPDGTGLDYTKFNVPFGFYHMIGNNPSTVTMSYTMTGRMVGNVTPVLPLYNGWTAVSNGYMGQIDAVELFDYMVSRATSGSNIEASIYTYEQQGTAMVWNPSNPLSWAVKKINPMNAFMFRNNGGMESVSMSYEDMVWTPSTTPSGAPMRQPAFNNLSRVMMHLQNANGVYDRLTIAQSSDFMSEHNLYDAEQYMNEEINFYVTDDNRFAIFAKDNLANTYLGFSCVHGGVFTLYFDNVEGEELSLIDLSTNTTIAMVQGTSYQFTANDNETNDYRFKVVGRQEMPTEIETVENATISNGGIYTITGQYVGEMNIWNTLPAGLYIVNGEKRIK